MILWRSLLLMYLLQCFFSTAAWGQKIKLLQTTRLPHYPSASALEYYNGRLFVMGDDAPYLLVMDRNHRAVDSLVLFPSQKKRIGKKVKPDIESAVVLSEKGNTSLALFSSFSDKQRNKIVSVDIRKGAGRMKKSSVREVSSPLQISQVPETNLEGAALIGDHLVFSNRANNSHRRNHLVVTKFEGENSLGNGRQHVITVRLPEQKGVTGISGLAYLKEKDMLVFTASSENTSDVTSDGTIGDSYIGFIPRISGKLSADQVDVPKLINLSSLFEKGVRYKIESIAVEKSSGPELTLHLAADNDNGESTLFKAELRWEEKK